MNPNGKVNAFMKEKCGKEIYNIIFFDMFHTFYVAVLATSRLKRKLFIIELGEVGKQFSLYFKDVYISKFQCDRNSFAANSMSGITTCENLLIS
jgi:hypothetical protein